MPREGCMRFLCSGLLREIRSAWASPFVSFSITPMECPDLCVCVLSTSCTYVNAFPVDVPATQVSHLQASDRQALQGLAAAVGERLGGLGALAQVRLEGMSHSSKLICFSTGFL